MPQITKISLAPEKSTRYALWAILWTVTITVLSLTPASKISSIETPLLSDKVVHFFFYAGFTLLWQAHFKERKIRYSTLKIFLLSVFYGIIIEVLQNRMQMGRHADVTDVLANTAGTLTMLLLTEVYRRLQIKNSKN